MARNSRRKFLAGFLTGLYGQSHRCDRVRVGRSDVMLLEAGVATIDKAGSKCSPMLPKIMPFSVDATFMLALMFVKS